MSEFDQVRQLLLGPEQQRLADLQQQLQDPAQRARDLAAVLPEAVRAGSGADQRLAAALQQPVADGLQRAVTQDPERLAGALFPVLGPAIRRAIGEALKALVQAINQAVEHSLSPRGLRWRWEAWRSGSSFAEVVLKNTLIYRVEAAYLIHNDSGLLIEHAVATTQTTLKDEEAISAMLSAIASFVQDAFSGSGEHLDTVEIGARTLWLVHGPAASLACVISGVPPTALRNHLEGLLREAHLAFGPALAAFNGERAPLAAMQPLLADCLALEYREPPAHRRIRWWPWLLALLLAVGALGWQGLRAWHWHTRAAAARAALATAPGLVLLEWHPGRRAPSARVLRDPLAADPLTLIDAPEVRARLQLEERPFVSLEPDLVLARAARQLRPPAGVSLTLHRQDGAQVLLVAGSAPPAWIAALQGQVLLPAGLDALDLSALHTDRASLAQAVNAALAPPPGVALHLDGTRLMVSGSAPWDWIAALPPRVAALGDLGGCDNGGLTIAELTAARSLARRLAALQVRFGDDINLAPGQQQVLEEAAALGRELAALAAVLPLTLRIVAVGHSDGLGSEQWNYWLRRRRAEFVRAALADQGVAARLLAAEATTGFDPDTGRMPPLRRVELRVELQGPAVPSCAFAADR